MVDDGHRARMVLTEFERWLAETQATSPEMAAVLARQLEIVKRRLAAGEEVDVAALQVGDASARFAALAKSADEPQA